MFAPLPLAIGRFCAIDQVDDLFTVDSDDGDRFHVARAVGAGDWPTPGRLWRAKGRLPDVTTKSNGENAGGDSSGVILSINSPRRRSERTASLAPSPVAAVRQEKNAGSGESPEPNRRPVGVCVLIWLALLVPIWAGIIALVAALARSADIWGWPAAAALAYGAGAFIAWLTW